MAASTLTPREARVRQVFIDAAYERDPGAGMAVAVREGVATWREWRSGSGGTRQAARTGTAAPSAAIAEAVAAAVGQALAARKAARKAAKRAARETAAARVQPARTLTEAQVAGALREASREELASLAAVAETGRSPFFRAAPGAAAARMAAARGAAVSETAVSEAAEVRSLAALSAAGLREHLKGRLNVLGEASGFRSPSWTGGTHA